MKKRRLSLTLVVLSSLLLAAGPLRLGTVVRAAAALLPVIDDFESGLPAGQDPNGVAIGFITFSDPNSTVAISTTATPPAPVPGAADPNNVLKMDFNVVSYAGFVHSFENAAVDAVGDPGLERLRGHLVLALRQQQRHRPCSWTCSTTATPARPRTTPSAGRSTFRTTSAAGSEIQLPFASMHRKEIGNGAPNDGFGLTEVHGWALGHDHHAGPQSLLRRRRQGLRHRADRAADGAASAPINYSVTEGARGHRHGQAEQTVGRTR